MIPTSSLSVRVDPELAKEAGPLLHGWARRTKVGKRSYPRHIHALSKIEQGTALYEALGGDEMRNWIKAYVPEPISIPQYNGYPIDVRGLPYDGPNNGRDLDGQWFSERTEFFEGEIPFPPVILMHGASNGLSTDNVGDVVARWYDDTGGWFKVILDPTHPDYASLVEAHQLGVLKASTGVVPAKYKWQKSNGHIDEWLVGELSLIDTRKGYRPSNGYAITKAVDVVLTDYYGDEVYEADCDMKDKIQQLFDNLKSGLDNLFKSEPITEVPSVEPCTTCDQEVEAEAQRLAKALNEMVEEEAKPKECLPCRAALQRVEALVKAHQMTPLEGLELIEKFRKDATGADEILDVVEARETTVVAAVAKARTSGEQLYIAGGQAPAPAQTTQNAEYMNRLRRLAGKPEVK